MRACRHVLGVRAVLAAAALAAMGASAAPVLAGLVIPTNFDGYGTTVAGYQDFFTGATLNSAWTTVGGQTGEFTADPADGWLQVNQLSGAVGDPNHLLYEPAGVPYDPLNQNVLMLVQVNAGDGSDGFAGPAVNVNGSTSQGYDALYRNWSTTAGRKLFISSMTRGLGAPARRSPSLRAPGSGFARPAAAARR